MKCPTPKTIYPHRSIDWLDAGNEEKPILVPCGKCPACLTNSRNDWSFRLKQEHKRSKNGYFVTLTYDEKHMPSDGLLRKTDVQLYMKRLRKRNGTGKIGIRYFAVGEYGEKSGRAHYHLLLFNVVEETIRGAWCDSNGDPIGIVHVGKVTDASVAYVTKYIVQAEPLPKMKRDANDKPIYDGRPFRLMSRAYGIGAHYLSDDMVDWHRVNDANYVVLPGGERGRLPRFYKDKIWHKPVDRERIASNAIRESVKQQQQEEAHYRSRYGDRWASVMVEFQMRVLARVKQKSRFTQTL